MALAYTLGPGRLGESRDVKFSPLSTYWERFSESKGRSAFLEDGRRREPRLSTLDRVQHVPHSSHTRPFSEEWPQRRMIAHALKDDEAKRPNGAVAHTTVKFDAVDR